MALLSTINCLRCGKTKQVCHNASDYPSICNDCRNEESDTKKKAHLKECRSRPVHERLARIEAILYDEAQKPPVWHDQPIG